MLVPNTDYAMINMRFFQIIVVVLLFGRGVNAQITIAPESRCSTYTRADYAYSQSVELQIIAVNLQGNIVSPYTGEVFSDRLQTEIEHIVAISEAHDSGLCAENKTVRRQFAKDLENLTLASPSVNQTKSDKDLSDWLPAQNLCWYVQTVVRVKAKYGLSMNFHEAFRALQILIEDCALPAACHLPSFADALNCYAAGSSQGSAESSESSDSAPDLESVDSNGNGRITCAEARAAGLPIPVRQEHWAYAYMQDRDGDGKVCE